MNEEVGQAVLEGERSSYLGENVLNVRQKDYSEATAREFDLAVRQLLDEAYAEAKAILTQRSAELEAGAQLLLEKETVTPDDFPPIRSPSPAEASAD